MKKYNIIKFIFASLILLLGLSACEDFLDRPNEDGYNLGNFFQTEEQCIQSVNPIYNSPWYDFQRGFFKVSEVQSGNYYWSESPYLTFTLNSSDEDLANMSASLWAVNAYCNTTLENIDMYASDAVSEKIKKQVKGEALVWKAMSYFYLVRVFGEVPIVHNNSAEIAAGDYNQKYKATIPNVYDYIIMTLEQAIEWLPEKNSPGRIDKYSAYGLLSKVYLTKSGYGQSGSRSQEDLDNAAKYALKVINESGRELEPVYSDIFRLANNFSKESLLAWHWNGSREPWTQQNTLQSDLALTNFSEFGDTWGGYNGPSVDLQEAFGENALSQTRNNKDKRRKATMMMAGDVYEYFWVDKGGFDWLDYNLNVLDEVQSPTGANQVKHLVGNNNDHILGNGKEMANMATGLSTHILRLADIYLVYAEAVLGNQASTNDAEALRAINMVKARAYGIEYENFIESDDKFESITFDDVWLERRLELATEGDHWYDYVRLHYYKPAEAIAKIRAQKRNSYQGLKDYYNNNFTNKEDSEAIYDETAPRPNITDSHFKLPFPDTDLTMNKLLLDEPKEIDISQFTY